MSELHVEPTTAAPSARRASVIGARATYWAPVWVPMILLAQVALLGLGPALAEQRRLERAATDLDARTTSELDERAELGRVVEAQSDPIYLERERRLLRAEDGPLSIK